MSSGDINPRRVPKSQSPPHLCTQSMLPSEGRGKGEEEEETGQATCRASDPRHHKACQSSGGGSGQCGHQDSRGPARYPLSRKARGTVIIEGTDPDMTPIGISGSPLPRAGVPPRHLFLLPGSRGSRSSSGGPQRGQASSP